MADIYFPNVMSALPEPRFVEPQSNTGAMAMGSALQALTSVAGNFRQKEMNVQKANQMADALEKEGLVQEANLYRQAAQSYQMDFFATPQENERFNQSLLNDTLRLLTNKQEREMKAEQLKLETQYKRSLIENQEAETVRAGRRLTLDERLAGIREDELKESLETKRESITQKDEAAKLRNIGIASTQLNKQIEEINRQRDALLKQRKAETINEQDYIQSDNLLVKQLNNLNKQNDAINKAMLDVQGYKGLVFQTPEARINKVVTQREQDAIDEAEAIAELGKSPWLDSVTKNGKVYRRPKPTEVTTITGTDAQGLPINRIERNEFVQPGATATGTALDPKARSFIPSATVPNLNQ